MLKKAMNSQGMIVVGDKDAKNKFPPGFAYRIGSIIYTVKEILTKESGAQLRRVETSEGTTEITSIESIEKDLKEPGCQIIAQGRLPSVPLPPPVENKEKTKPVIKKEVKRKK